MKRQALEDPLPARPARRQPQTSCDSCRQKKLKCDRDQPCSSCRVRGLTCSLLPITLPSPLPTTPETQTTSSATSILGRLAALEQAVFNHKTSPRYGLLNNSFDVERRRTPVIESTEESRQTAIFLDAAHHRGLAAKPEGHLITCVADTWQHSVAILSPRTSSPIWLVPHKDALAMAQDFVENACHLMPIIHIASARAVINRLYAAVKAGDSDKVDPSHVALVFSICSTCAFFWNATVPCQHTFGTEEAAMDASRSWGMLALQSLENGHRLGSRALEGAQAYAILTYMSFNTYGSSIRFYDLHNRSVTACRDLGIHLVDSRASVSTDGPAVREMKRRLWWHVATTDWMLGLSGGPFDGTYTIHPRHMRVAAPRNLNDADVGIDSDELAYPSHTATQTSCFLQAIRLGEVSRAVVDARHLDDDVVDQEHNNRILALDNLFKEALDAFPPPLALDAPIRQGAPRFLCLQRASVQMGFYSRRARLHHPFLLHKDVNGRFNPQFRTSRQICVQSARMVLDISTALMDHSLLRKQESTLRPKPQPHLHSRSILHHLGHEECPGFPAHRLGIVVNHMFWACSILAFDSNMRRSGSCGVQNDSFSECDDDDDLHEKLVRACRLFAILGEKCAAAADIVNGMRRVFTKYRIHGGEALAVVEGNRPPAEICLSSTDGSAQAIGGTTWPGPYDVGNAMMEKGVARDQDLFGDIDFASELDIDSLEGLFLSNNMQNGWDQIMTGPNTYPGC